MTQYAGQNKLATTIPLPDANTPFNASAIGAPIAANRDSIVALTNSGLYKTTLNAAKPPYPLAGEHTNSGTYKLAGAISFTASGVNSLVHTTAHAYARSARPFAQFDSSQWTSFFINSGDPQYQTPVKTSAIPLVFEFDLPDGITIEQVSLRVEPDNSHVALPNVMPRFDVYLADNSTGNKTLLVTGTDASVDATAYNLPHNITATVASVAFGAWKNSLYVRVYGESGVDAVNNFISCVPIVEFNRTRIAIEFGELLP